MSEEPDTGTSSRRPGRSAPSLFEVTLEGTQAEVRGLLGQVLNALEPLCLAAEESAAVELVLAEALNNIFEHAYGGVRGPRPVTLSCCLRGDGLHITLVDMGQPMPGGGLPLGRARSVEGDLADLPEGGFGWFLIKDLARDVSYLRLGNENHLHFRLDVGRRRAARH